MDDLSHLIDGVVEPVVEAMHEDEHAAVARDMRFHPGLRLPRSGERGDFERCEIGLWIGRQVFRPSHLTGLPLAGRGIEMAISVNEISLSRSPVKRMP